MLYEFQQLIVNYSFDFYNLWEELHLEEISNNLETEWTTQIIGKGHGLPMSAYFRNENWIQVKDSERGAKYSKFCDIKNMKK